MNAIYTRWEKNLHKVCVDFPIQFVFLFIWQWIIWNWNLVLIYKYFGSVDSMRILSDNYVTQLIYWISAEMYDTCISSMLCIKSKQHSSCVSASSWFGSRKGNKMRLECNMDMMICAFMWVEQSFISLHKRMKGLIDKGIFFFKKNLK